MSRANRDATTGPAPVQCCDRCSGRGWLDRGNGPEICRECKGEPYYTVNPATGVRKAVDWKKGRK